jgi:hypothetical protein
MDDGYKDRNRSPRQDQDAPLNASWTWAVIVLPFVITFLLGGIGAAEVFTGNDAQVGLLFARPVFACFIGAWLSLVTLPSVAYYERTNRLKLLSSLAGIALSFGCLIYMGVIKV